LKKIIIFIFFVSQIKAVEFQLKGYWNQGAGGNNERLIICDTDRDSLFELIFYGGPPQNSTGVIFEQSSSNPFQFEFQASIGKWVIPWVIGDYDMDGLYEIMCEASFGSAVGITFYEQPDSFYYPVVEIWRDTTYGGSSGLASGDADNDGLLDILISSGGKILIYETRGNNLFERVFEDTFPSQSYGYGTGISSPMDYDGDGKKEFVIGSIHERVLLGENRQNDIYCFIWKSPPLYTRNIFDVKSLPDLDHDGKNEFMVKGWVYPTATVHCFICEATGNNNYEVIWDTIYSTVSCGAGLSDIGDIDMDGEIEIVLEYGDGFKVLKSIDNNKFVEIGNVLVNPGTSQIKIAPDLDRNGINEIVVSGGNRETYFFEAILNVNEKKLKIPFSKIELKDYKIFDFTGREVKKMEKGIYFLKVKEGKIFKIIKIK
jgi:hypothetical protein